MYNKDNDPFGYLKDKFSECETYFYEYNNPKQNDPTCWDVICPVTISWIGIQECQCDSIGSKNNTCQTIGGQCNCKPNVYGKKCNACIPSTWNFSPEGCRGKRIEKKIENIFHLELF